MFNRVSEWLDVVLETDIPNEVVAFGFNLYEDEQYNWSMELIGASEFDIDDEDWLCNEVTDFNTRDNPLRWHKETGHEEILNDIVCALKEYLKNGKYADILKTKSGVGVGFVDGSIEILLAEKRFTSPRFRSFVIGKESTDMRKVAAFIISIIFSMSLFWVLEPTISRHNKANSNDTPQQTEDFEEESSMSSNQEKPESGQLKYQVYIQPDMPEPFIEVLRQYEEFMNADNQNLNDEDVQKKIYSVDGEWRYLYYESWLSALWRGEEGVIRYSLEDLTGDGYPELVMGYCFSDDTTSPEVVYYYSQTEGIKMECRSSYYYMVLYEDSVIEYISGGMTYTETFIQFQEETESWQQAACVVVDWDDETDSVRGYYWGDDLRGYLTDNRPMTVEEYQKIIAQYAAEPVELEWTPLILSSEL